MKKNKKSRKSSGPVNRPLYSGGQWPSSYERRAHAGLWFDKFCDSWSPFQPGQWSSWNAFGDSGKRAWLDQFDAEVVGDSAMLAEWKMRRKQFARRRNGVSFEVTTQSRFITGMGREHPVENGMAWHPVLGTPYLPGSGVKGIVRSWVRDWLTDGNEESDDSVRIFGTLDDGVGSLIFLEAIPTRIVRLATDVMTPHYGPWHRGDQESAPGDWHDPTPIPFLTVDTGATFQFCICPRQPQNDRHRQDAQLAAKWLPQALKYIGAGAKTSVGYGRFE